MRSGPRFDGAGHKGREGASGTCINNDNPLIAQYFSTIPERDILVNRGAGASVGLFAVEHEFPRVDSSIPLLGLGLRPARTYFGNGNASARIWENFCYHCFCFFCR
jgi:hypothetical protein